METCMIRTQVYEWTEKFKNGVTSVEDSPRPGPAFTAVTEDNIAAVENVIRENRRVTVKEVASLLDISVGSAHHIIHDELNFQKVCARWVSKQLTPEMKERRVDACQELLRVWGWWWSISAAYRHWGWELSTLLRARTKATKHGMAPHLVPKTEEGAGATICRQSHVDFLLGLQRADLRALHAQRKHCDQCHLLKPSEGKSEACDSPETARVVDDGSVSPPRKCKATYCCSNSVDYWGAAVWVHPTPSVLTRPRAVAFSRLWSIEGCAEWNAVPGWQWGLVGGTWVAVHPSERILFPRNLHACQALA